MRTVGPVRSKRETTMATEAATLSLRGISGKGLGAPVLLVMMLAMVIIPLPPIALDMFFTFNITLSLVV